MRRHAFLEDGAFTPAPAAAAGLRPAAAWNATALRAIRAARMEPRAAARTLALVHTCMYNAWAAYDDAARQTAHGMAIRLPRPQRDAASRAGALHQAAWVVLCARFPGQRASFDAHMAGLGLDPAAPVGQFSPAGIGWSQALSMLDAWGLGALDNRFAPFAPCPEALLAAVPASPANPYVVDDALPGRCCLHARTAWLQAAASGHGDAGGDRDVLFYFVLANALADAAWAAAGHGHAPDVWMAAVDEVVRRLTGVRPAAGGGAAGDTEGDARARWIGRKIGGRVHDKARRYWQGKP